MKSAPKLMFLALALAVILAAGQASLALAAETAFKQYTKIVKTDAVKAVVDGKTKGVIIDSRPYQKQYLKGHIPGALNLPSSQFDKKAAKVLPKDKATLLVFYCGGLKCALSHQGAFAAEKLGYSNIQVYADGFPVWKKSGGQVVTGPWALKPPFQTWTKIVKAAAVKDVVDGKTLGMVVDSRPKKGKYDKGHIPGSISLPFGAFDKMAGLLPADKNALVIFYCGGLECPLSHKSAYAAQKLGYSNLAVFAEGYPVWKKTYGAGVSGPAKAAAKPAGKKMFKAGKEEGSIDHAAFAQALKGKPGSVLIVDVRDAHEYKAGTIKGAVNMTVNQLEKELATWKPGKPVIFVCGTGARSGEAFYMVKDKRPDLTEVYYVDGEMTFDKKGSYTLKKSK